MIAFAKPQTHGYTTVLPAVQKSARFNNEQPTTERTLALLGAIGGAYVDDLESLEEIQAMLKRSGKPDAGKDNRDKLGAGKVSADRLMAALGIARAPMAITPRKDLASRQINA